MHTARQRQWSMMANKSGLVYGLLLLLPPSETCKVVVELSVACRRSVQVYKTIDRCVRQDEIESLADYNRGSYVGPV